MKNALNWFEIPTIDIHRAAKFYNQILGTKLQVSLDMGTPMAFFPTTKSGVSGGLVQKTEYDTSSVEEGVLIYFNGGNDLNVVLGRVEKAGGKVVQPKKEITPKKGYVALFLDTEGNRIALHSRG